MDLGVDGVIKEKCKKLISFFTKHADEPPPSTKDLVDPCVGVTLGGNTVSVVMCQGSTL